jgi:hypothetical protein
MFLRNSANYLQDHTAPQPIKGPQVTSHRPENLKSKIATTSLTYRTIINFLRNWFLLPFSISINIRFYSRQTNRCIYDTTYDRNLLFKKRVVREITSKQI